MEFTVEKATASKNGGFVITMRAQDVVDKETGFYSKGLKRFSKNIEQLKIGSKVELDLTKFEEIRIEGVYTDPETGEERTYTNVWLKFKGE